MTLGPGVVLEKRYRIDRLVGQGGMGAVYCGYDRRLEIAVAIKESLFVAPDAHRQFQKEARILARLGHPNLPKVTDYFRVGNAEYLVMEFITGKTLEEIIQHSGALPEQEVLAWIAQVCDALEYLHGQKPPIVHRDIKPANIILTPDGRIVLVDFGIVKVGAARMLTSTGARAVTPGYSPPEQYGGGGTDVRSDIYSLAATLYTLLTGQVPTESIQIVTGQEELLPPSHLRPGLSTNMEEAVVQGLALRPSDRPQTVEQFRLQLSTKRHRPAVDVPQGGMPKRPEIRSITPECAGNLQRLHVLTGHTDKIFGLAFAPDSKMLISCAGDRTIKLWDVTNGQLLYTLQGHKAPVNTIAATPDGAVLASGSDDKQVMLWEMIRWQELRTFTGHKKGIEGIACSPDGQFVASGSVDTTIKIWSVQGKGQPRTLVGLSDPVLHVAFSPDGKILASGSGSPQLFGGTIALWDTRTGRMLYSLRGHALPVTAVDFSPDGSTLVSGSMDGTIKLWDVSNMQEIRTFGTLLRPLSLPAEMVLATVFSRNGQIIASGSSTGFLKLWDAGSGRELCAWRTHQEAVQRLAFSRDGRMLASASWDNTIQLRGIT